MKATPIVRKTPMKRTTMVSKPKPKTGEPKAIKCGVKDCRKPFVPAKPFIKFCSPECGTAMALALVAAQKAKAARADRVETKRKLDGYKSMNDLKAEAQVVFNRYVRLRDELAALPCICCDRMPTGGNLTGGDWDAAHYRSRGSADHLRFDERNVHRSLKNCNTFGHTDYRSGLIRRIGLEAVEALECDQTIVKWTPELLVSIKTMYAKKIKALKGKK